TVSTYLELPQSKRIDVANRVSPDIGIGIQPTRQSNRIALQIPPDHRIVVPIDVVPKPGFLIPVLPREPDVEPTDAVERHRAVESRIAGPPHRGLGAVGHQFRASDL